MTLFQLYKLIKANQALSDKRHPMLEKNKAMKVFMWIMVAFWAGYLLVFGTMFGTLFSSKPTYNVINGGIIVFLIIDFFTRFAMTETPAHELKPYKLLPINEWSLLKVFLVRIGLRAYNLFWLFFFVPFAIFTILTSANYGFSNFVVYLVLIWLLFVMNSYWYLLWRTFVNHRIWWIVAPILIYAALIYFGMVEGDWFFRFCKYSIHDAVCMKLLPFVYVIAAIVIFYIINLYVQDKFIYYEIAKVEKVMKVKPTELSFFNRFGTIGEYMKLEVKSIQRNKTVRKQFLSGLIASLMLSLLFAFTDAYDSQPFMKVFICMYCFAALGVINLTAVMCAEGNYIDCLMSHKESILSLLKAKYYFNLMLMVLPLLIMLMPIFQGKTQWIEALACMAFAAGVIMPFLFQLAVYNSNTIKLNEVMTKSGQSNKNQMICSLVAMFLPMGIMYAFIQIFGQNIGCVIIFLIGVLGVALHNMWLGNIYQRFMKRRYENMANFRATK